METECTCWEDNIQEFCQCLALNIGGNDKRDNVDDHEEQDSVFEGTFSLVEDKAEAIYKTDEWEGEEDDVDEEHECMLFESIKLKHKHHYD